MLPMKFIRENPEVVKNNFKRRGELDKISWVDDLLKKDSEWRKLKKEVDELRRQRNDISLKINEEKKKGKDVSSLLKNAKEIPQLILEKERAMLELQEKIEWYLMRIPNILHESVPFGKSDKDNVEIKRWGEPKKFDFELKSHGELIENIGCADFKRAAKIAGAGFVFLKNEIALLDIALQRFAIDFLRKKGFTLIEPPFMMNRKAYEGVTSLADFENVMYKIENEDLYLIATSEHPMVAMFQNEILNEKDLPIYLCGISPCFRKEIGSHGVDTRGLFRMHQFNKVEQVVFCKPEDSWRIFEEILRNSEEMLQLLKIPYRVVNICTGDMGIVAAKKYDIEAWFPRENQYKEVCSCSNCTSYQAVRLNIKYKSKKGTEYVHTLNNTGIATSRVMRAIIENYQNKDGSITIPDVLVPYMGGIKVIKKESKKN